MEEWRTGFIDKTGKYVIEPQFWAACNFYDGLAKVKTFQNKTGYIDRTGRFVIPPRFDGAEYKFSEGLAYVVSNGKAGFIDKTGRFIIEPKFDHRFILPGFQEGLAPMYCGDKMGYIDKSGRFIIAPKYFIAGPFFEGLAKVDGGFIDKTGKIIIEPKFESVGDFRGGLAPVQYGGKWGFIDKTGQFVIKSIFESAVPFNNDLAFVQYGGKCGCIDKTGQFVIEPKFENIKSYLGFSEGFAIVRYGGKEGFIDKTGNFVIKPIYDYVGDFHEGLAWVTTIKREIQESYSQPIIHNTSIPQQKTVSPPVPSHVADRSSTLNSSTHIKSKPQQKNTSNSDLVESKIKEILRRGERYKLNAVRLYCDETGADLKSAKEYVDRLWLQQNNHKGSGCYIATAVYGSYDCPEAWTLRRYRDNVLDNSWYGRLFIKCYYAISPTLVKWFGKSNWFRNLFSKPLDRWVNKLNNSGFENTPYNDKY